MLGGTHRRRQSARLPTLNTTFRGEGGGSRDLGVWTDLDDPWTNTRGVNSVARGGALADYDALLDAVGAVLTMPLWRRRR